MQVLVSGVLVSLLVACTGGGGGTRGRAGGAPASSTVAGPATAAACVDLVAGRPVAVAAWGVELQATGADVAVDEVTVTYVPADRSLTLVTPARPAGACAARPCEATFSLTPPEAGTF